MTQVPLGYGDKRYLTQREVEVCRAHGVAATRTWIIYRDGGAIVVGKRAWAASNFGYGMQHAPYLG